MANEILRRDDNSIPVLAGITDDTNQEIRMLRVDPVTGRLKVTGLGGGGSSFIQPTSGALNQATFVWSTAPNVIFIDGVPRQKVSTDGTVNWTGTTTTVLTIYPTFDIFGLS